MALFKTILKTSIQTQCIKFYNVIHAWLFSDATIQDRGTGARTSDGLCILDIVKHAVKTCAHSLHSLDRLSIVTFSTNATVLAPLTFVNDEGLDIIDAAVSQMLPDDNTNLWAGLITGNSQQCHISCSKPILCATVLHGFYTTHGASRIGDFEVKRWC